MEENLLLKQYCLDNLDYSASPQIIVEQMLRLNAEGIRANPILRQWYQSGVYHKLEQVYREEHAMGSMTLACVLVLLAWPTRWRGWVVGAMAVFVPMVGLSRVYLGVHFPSDILAGWAAAATWAVGTYLVVFRNGRFGGHPASVDAGR